MMEMKRLRVQTPGVVQTQPQLNFSEFQNLPTDISENYLLTQVPFETLLSLCQTNSRYAEICRTRAWSYLIERDFLGSGIPSRSFYQGSFGPYLYQAVRNLVMKNPPNLRQIVEQSAREIQNLDWFLRRMSAILPIQTIYIDVSGIGITFDDKKGVATRFYLYPDVIQIDFENNFALDSGTESLDLTFRMYRQDVTDTLLTVLLLLFAYYRTIGVEVLSPNGFNDPNIVRAIIGPLEIFRDNYPQLGESQETHYYYLDDPRSGNDDEAPATVSVHLE